jgi:hypothetical protein
MESAREGQSTASAGEDETPPSQEDGRSSSQEEDRSSSQAEGHSSAGEEETTEASGGEDERAGSEDEEDGSESESKVASAIEDVSALPGETLSDQDGRKIGEVKDIYAVGEDETPMWVTVESSTGLGRTRMVFIPLARIKQQSDEIRVPYSFAHIHESPDVEAGDGISEEDDRALRSYYAIGLGDQELVQSARSYASQVPEEEGEARKIDTDAAEGPVRELDDTPPAERVAEAYEKQKEEEGEEHRKGREATADDVVEEDGGSDGDDSEDKSSDEPKGKSEEEPKAEDGDEPKNESKQESDGEKDGD